MQIPQLENLKRFLEELNISMSIGSGASLPRLHNNKGQALTPFAIVEIQELLFDALRMHVKKNAWKLTPLSFEETKELSSRLCECFETVPDTFGHESEDSVCSVCGKPADLRCSKCKSIMYCGSDCQLSDWQSHKLLCK
jgi:hypothetical protein